MKIVDFGRLNGLLQAKGARLESDEGIAIVKIG